MKLKLDDDGKAVLNDGKPVYIADDGKELDVDVPVLFKKVSDLNSESKGHRERAESAEKTLKIFDGIDLEALPDWKTKAEEAIATVKNYDDKQLVDAGKVDEIKAQMKTAHEEEKDKLLKSFTEKEAANVELIKSKDTTIYTLMVSSQFARSPLFSGENPKTLLPPEIAENYFGKNFKVEAGDNGDLRVVGYLGKDPIYSRKNPGELAGFDEAIEDILEKYPQKDKILRSTGGGSGAGGGGGGGGSGKSGNQLAKLREQYKTATDANDARTAIAIKNRIWELQRTQQST